MWRGRLLLTNQYISTYSDRLCQFRISLGENDSNYVMRSKHVISTSFHCQFYVAQNLNLNPFSNMISKKLLPWEGIRRLFSVLDEARRERIDYTSDSTNSWLD